MATAAFTRFCSRGHGTLRFRLMVEGWPYEWVTSSRITHADNRDGRTVVVGLKQDGLQIGERVVMQEALLECDSITFKIVPTKRVSGGGDNATLMFSLHPTPVAALAVSIDEDDAAIPTAGLVGGVGVELEDNTVYHLATETIRVGTYPAITRHIWDTQPQAHEISYFDESQAVYVYEHPVTMDGRRCALYAYADGEDMDGDGQVLWRGVVSRPPQLESDGLTWVIQAEPVTQLLRQSVAGGIATAHPIGIYHHSWCAFGYKFINVVNGDPAPSTYTGFDSEASLALNISTALTTAMAAAGITQIDTISFQKTVEGRWRVAIRTNAEVPKFALVLGSPLLGTASSGIDMWVDSLSGLPRDGNNTLLSANRDYVCTLVPNNSGLAGSGFASLGITSFQMDGTTAAPIGVASHSMQPHPAFGLAAFIDTAAYLTHPPWRIYVDKDFVGVAAVHIPGTFKPDGIFAVATTGDVDNKFYIELEPSQGRPALPGSEEWLWYQGFVGFATGETEISAVRDYGGIASVCGFIEAIKAQSIEANRGDTPFVTDDDLTTWEFGDDGVVAIVQQSRVYRFIREIGLDKILAEELKLAAHFPRLAEDGRIEIVPLPNFTDAEVVQSTHEITAATILTPADGVGAWPNWEPQRDGFITTVEIQQQYDPIEDKWTDTPRVFQDSHAIATHKTRGRPRMTIKPYSALGGEYRIEQLTIRSIPEAFLSVFARDYSTVTLELPFKHYSIKCGDIVAITHQLIPDGQGGRGVVGRRAVCIDRRWNLDASQASMGTLTFLMSNEGIRGYAPSAVLVSQTDQGSNVWLLIVSDAEYVNVQLSTRGDGRVLEHFQVGDYIRVVKRNDALGTQVTGVVTGAPNVSLGTMVVTLDGAWTPGADSWIVEAQTDSDGNHSSDHQRQFAYVAGADLRTGAEVFAERFA